MVAMVTMMVPGRGKRRSGNHHHEQGGEQEFPHGSNRSTASIGPTYHFEEEVDHPHQG